MKPILKSFAILCFICSTLAYSQGIPEEIDRSAVDNTIISSTMQSRNHKTLYAAVRAADLLETLDGTGPYTVFAPSDLAFKKLSAGMIKSLLQPENKKELQAMVTSHIVAGNISAAKILMAMCQGSGKAIFTTIKGEELTATMDGIDIILTDINGNRARITTADANQRNGVIHVIDCVFIPRRI